MALPEKIHLEIVTPEKHLFSGDVDSITVPANTGYLGILPGHAPLLAELGIGEIEYIMNGRAEFLFCSWGFIEVLPERVVLLAQVAETGSDIDIKRAEEAKSRAEKMLTSSSVDIDFNRAQLALMRAIARLNTAKHKAADK
jgi:F-type H+-transporting ATPase subunit epsilon